MTQRPRGNTYFRMPALCSDRTSRYEQQHTAHRDGKGHEAVCMTNLLLCASSQLTDQESIKRCIEECEARIEIGKSGLHKCPYISLD